MGSVSDNLWAEGAHSSQLESYALSQTLLLRVHTEGTKEHFTHTDDVQRALNYRGLLPALTSRHRLAAADNAELRLIVGS